MRARAVGINHVAIEVGAVEEALAFYGRIFEFTLRGRSRNMAFIDMGDQFAALSAGGTQAPDGHDISASSWTARRRRDARSRRRAPRSCPDGVSTFATRGGGVRPRI